MTTELHQTQVHLEGLLEVLGKNLYSSPAVAIRELVQNAHDACIRRRLEAGFNAEMKITLRPRQDRHELVIEDNGSGLTHDEIVQFLATVGSGYTRVLRNQTQSEEMIGYFGLGFLSAYVVAAKVEVWTCSYQTPELAWHFVSSGGKRYTLEPAEPRGVGTTVKLGLTAEYADLCSGNVIRGLLQKYCCLLPIPIHLDDQSEPVNNLLIPWRVNEELTPFHRRRALIAFANLFEERFEPLCTIEIPENNLKVRGLLWIQDGAGFATSDYRNVSVFVRNMHITHEGRDLLPLWAGFAGCVLESEALTPTASREDLIQDSAYFQVKALLADTLVVGLKRIAQSEPENWRRIIKRHNQALMGACIADDSLFELLKHELRVPTNYGDLTVNQILKRSAQTLYVRTDDRNNYEEVLFKARAIPVVSGFMFAAASFSQKVADSLNLPIHYIGLNQKISDLFPVQDCSEPALERMRTLFCVAGEGLIASAFEPPYIPLLIMEDKEVKLKERLEQEDADRRIGTAALMLAKMHTQTVKAGERRKVIVNLENPIVQHLIKGSDPEGDTRIAHLMRSFMLTQCCHPSDDDIDFSVEIQKFMVGLQAITLGA